MGTLRLASSRLRAGTVTSSTPIAVTRRHLLGLDPARQAEGTFKPSVGNFTQVEVGVLLLALLFLFAPQDQAAVLDGHLDVPGVDAGELGLENQGIPAAEGFHRRKGTACRPVQRGRGALRSCLGALGAAGALPEQVVKAVKDVGEFIVRSPANQHGVTSREETF